MAIGIDDAALQAQVQEVLAHCDALEIGDDDAVLEAYRRHTGLIPDTQRLTLYHALTALAYLAWRVDDPEAHDRLSGRDKAGAYRWVQQAVAWALARTDSDYDLLVLVDGEVDWKLEDQIRQCLYPLELATGAVLTVHAYSRRTWDSALYRAI